MRIAHSRRILLAALAVLSAPIAAHAQDLTASAPVDVSVTVYRDPFRSEGGFDLDNLNGFALITETRRVVLMPGQHRLRFEGVADGIEPASAFLLASSKRTATPPCSAPLLWSMQLRPSRAASC
jgi:hypothetical protein